MSTTKEYIKLRSILPHTNFIPQYIEYWQERSGGYSEMGHGAAITLLSMAADRRVSIPLSFDRVWTNCWSMIIGLSSISQKTTTIQQMEQFIDRERFGDGLPKSFSTEGFIDALDDEPRTYHILEEAGGLLAGFNKKSYLADARDLLCDLFDCRNISRRLRKKRGGEKTSFAVRDPYVSLLWATTPSGLENSTTAVDFTGGLLARFLIYRPMYGPTYKPVGLISIEMDAGLTALKNRYNEIVSTVSKFKDIRLKPTEESLSDYNEWQESIYKSVDVKEDADRTISGRMRSYVFKLAALYYLASEEFLTTAAADYDEQSIGKDESGVVYLTVELEIPTIYFTAALEDVKDYFIPVSSQEMKTVISKTSQNVQEKILQILRDNGGKIGWSPLLRKLRIKTKELEEQIAALINAESITEEYLLNSDTQGRTTSTRMINLCEVEK